MFNLEMLEQRRFLSVSVDEAADVYTAVEDDVVIDDEVIDPDAATCGFGEIDSDLADAPEGTPCEPIELSPDEVLILYAQFEEELVEEDPLEEEPSDINNENDDDEVLVDDELIYTCGFGELPYGHDALDADKMVEGAQGPIRTCGTPDPDQVEILVVNEEQPTEEGAPASPPPASPEEIVIFADEEAGDSDLEAADQGDNLLS